MLATAAGAWWWHAHPRASRAALIGAGAAQLAAFVGALHRYTVGLYGPWDLVGRVAEGWSAPLPALVLVTLYALALVAAWRLLAGVPDLPPRPPASEAHPRRQASSLKA